ncbi:MAG: methyltransferase domain-containing protein [Ilumatobacteraceae bacterium]
MSDDRPPTVPPDRSAEQTSQIEPGEAFATETRRAVAEARDGVVHEDPTLEARLALAFADALPMAMPAPTIEPLLEQLVAATAALTADVPTMSRHPAMAATKRAVQQLTAWYHEQVLAQHRVVNDAVANVLRNLDRRLYALEVEASVAHLGGRSEQVLAPPDDLPHDVARRAVELLTSRLDGSAESRVLHAEAGVGTALRALRAAGFDAYGVDPWLPPPGGLDEDIWRVDVLEHLRTVPDGSLDAVVLAGIVDTASIEDRLDVLRAAARVTRAGGPIVIVTETAESDAQRPRDGRRDLRPGRPLSASTWTRLLELHGAAARDVVDGVRDGERTFTMIAATKH